MKFVGNTFRMTESDYWVFAAKTVSFKTRPSNLSEMWETAGLRAVRVWPNDFGEIKVKTFCLVAEFQKGQCPKDADEFLRRFEDSERWDILPDTDVEDVKSEVEKLMRKNSETVISGIGTPAGYVWWYRIFTR